MTNTDTNKLLGEFSVNKAWSGRGSLGDLVAELDRQKSARFDFVADTRSLGVKVDDRGPVLHSQGIETTEFIPKAGLPIGDEAIAQLGDRLAPAIPRRFLRDLISDRPQIAEGLLTDLLHATGKPNLVRCLDDKVRAFLSDRYQPVDNYELAFTALEVAREQGGEVVECSLSEQNLRIKLTNRSVFDALDDVRTGTTGWFAGGIGNQKYLSRVAANTTGDLPGGPGTVHPLITIGNSETGHGSSHCRLGILKAICFNLATVETVVQQVHLGGRLEPGIFSQETIRKDAEVVLCKAKDAITTAFSTERFQHIINLCKVAQDTPVQRTKVIDFVVGEGLITQDQRDSLLLYFAAESETAYGFAQAAARLAQDIENGDTAADLEAFAGKVISKPSTLPLVAVLA